MSGFGYKHYVPFLKGKKGELDALSHVDVADRDHLTPLIEVPPLKVDPKTAATETVDDALDGLAERIVTGWGKIDECFVDTAMINRTARLDDGTHPVTRFFADARQAELIAIPVTSLDRDSAHHEAVAAVAVADRKGAAIRLRRADLSDPALLSARIEALRATLALERSALDLLLDFGEITATVVAPIRSEAEAALGVLPTPDQWRSLTLCSGAFPNSSAAFAKPGEVGERPRRDWDLWRQLAATDLPRKPAFGDYGVAHVDWVNYDPETMHPTAGIRYTIEDSWLMIRGRSLQKKGAYKQFHALARELIGRDECAKAEHCWGDRRIRACASQKVGTGSLTTWRTVGTSHHLAIVDQQLANLS